MNKRAWRGSDELREAARRLRREPTPAEELLWERLRDHRCGGYGFRRQASIGQFVVDFYCATARLAIELDGEVHDDAVVHKRDIERQSILERDYRLSVMRIPNSEVLANLDTTIALILARVTQCV